MGLLFTHVLNSWAAQDPFGLHELFNRPLDQRSDYSLLSDVCTESQHHIPVNWFTVLYCDSFQNQALVFIIILPLSFCILQIRHRQKRLPVHRHTPSLSHRRRFHAPSWPRSTFLPTSRC